LAGPATSLHDVDRRCDLIEATARHTTEREGAGPALKAEQRECHPNQEAGPAQRRQSGDNQEDDCSQALPNAPFRRRG